MEEQQAQVAKRTAGIPESKRPEKLATCKCRKPGRSRHTDRIMQDPAGNNIHQLGTEKKEKNIESYNIYHIDEIMNDFKIIKNQQKGKKGTP